MADVPATSPESDALSKDLKKRGFRFVGSMIIYAFMQTVGMVDDHTNGCFECQSIGRVWELPSFLFILASFSDLLRL